MFSVACCGGDREYLSVASVSQRVENERVQASGETVKRYRLRPVFGHIHNGSERIGISQYSAKRLDIQRVNSRI